jgi:hypothetical protein
MYALKIAPPMFSMCPYNNICHIHLIIYLLFPNLPIKLKFRIAKYGKLIKATHLD